MIQLAKSSALDRASCFTEGLENECCSQNHAPNSAPELFWIEEIRIGSKRQDIIRGGQCRGGSSIVEYVAVAKCVVGVIQKVECARRQLQVLRFSEMYILV